MMKLGLKVFLIAIFAISLFFFHPQSLYAHTPHDDVTELKLSPNYTQDQTLFILVRGNFLQSQDNGQSWRRLEQGLDNRGSLYRSASSLSVSTSSPEVLFLSSVDDGVFRSSDQGKSWTKRNQGLESLDINLVAIDPKNADFVLGANRKTGLYRTQDGGNYWQPIINDKKITAIAFLPSEEGGSQIAIGDDQGGFYLSDDQGDSWVKKYQPADSGRIRAIAISPHYEADQTLLIGTRKAGIFKSEDGGETFTETNQGILDKSITSLAFSPNYSSDQTIFATSFTEGVFQSQDQGNTWIRHNQGLKRNYQANDHRLPHFKHLQVSPNFAEDKTVFVAGFSGLFQSNDGGLVWQESVTLPSELLTGVAISPDYVNDKTAAIATYFGGGFVTQDGGSNWQPLLEKSRHLSSDVSDRLYALHFSPNYAEDRTIFGTTWQHLLRTDDDGKTWESIPLIKRKFGIINRGLSEKPVIAISQTFSQDKTLFVGTEQGQLYRSTDGGKAIRNLANLPLNIVSLAISPDFAADNTIYLGSVGKGVYQSVNAGKKWQPVNAGLPLSRSDATNIVISPNYSQDKTLFAATAQGLFKTTDAGNHWSNSPENSPVKSGFIEGLAISPAYATDSRLIISVRGKGLFESLDQGNNFTKLTNGNASNNMINFSHMRDFPVASNPFALSLNDFQPTDYLWVFWNHS